MKVPAHQINPRGYVEAHAPSDEASEIIMSMSQQINFIRKNINKDQELLKL